MEIPKGFNPNRHLYFYQSGGENHRFTYLIDLAKQCWWADPSHNQLKKCSQQELAVLAMMIFPKAEIDKVRAILDLPPIAD
jgi:hypothetical protein